jgi:hypothetical protein
MANLHFHPIFVLQSDMAVGKHMVVVQV